LKVNLVSESAFTVQGHGVHSAFTDTIDQLKDYTNVEVRVNSRLRADIIHIHTIGPYSLVKLLWGRGKKILSAHVMPESFVGSLVGAKYWQFLATGYLKWFYNKADAVLAVSQDVERSLVDMGVTKPVYYVPNTIKSTLFKSDSSKRSNARAKLGLSDTAFIVLGAGQVQPRKRIDTFIGVAAAVQDASFIWVGGLPFKKLAASSREMERMMRHHGPNVQFTGSIDRNLLITYLQAADLFFFPSAQETFGIVIVEAAAAGLPLLLRDLASYKDSFGDCYEIGDDITFAAKIAKFKDDDDYYDRWKKASKRVAAKYDAKVGAIRLLEVYNLVLSK
jgi:1,2-diacylglycerol-3-alpha-glucose alpha-1,2-galactosyltransferase